MPAYSFTTDERGFTAPYTDLLAPVIACAGVIIFAYLLYASYASCASDAYYAGVRGSLQAALSSLMNDPAIALDGMPGTLDAARLDLIDGREGPATRYGTPGSSVSAVVHSGDAEWAFGVEGKGRSASARFPVTIRFNDAVSHAGVMTLTVWEALP